MLYICHLNQAPLNYLAKFLIKSSAYSFQLVHAFSVPMACIKITVLHYIAMIKTL